MRIPFGNETVTLIKRVETQVDGKTRVRFAKHILVGCSWHRSAARIMGATEAVRTEEITCRIPEGRIAPEIGDCLFLGSVPEKITGSAELAEALHARKGSAFRVNSISDNTGKGKPMPHYAARGG